MRGYSKIKSRWDLFAEFNFIDFLYGIHVI